jgi:SAM-dependent methyltransferase
MMMEKQTFESLYRERKLTRGYPDLEKLGAEHFSHVHTDEAWVKRVMPLILDLVDIDALSRSVLVIGTGAKPHAMKELLEMGYDALGIEPIADYVRSAGEYISDPTRILQGAAEDIPLADESQGIVCLSSVLEHVDSPIKSLMEIYRVLKPGGVVYIETTNRLRVSLTGENGEFRTRFYNWLPAIVKESYVFQHLHYKPSLANFSSRPAVHWFTYADLCKLGRQAGFAQFYSPIDLISKDDDRFSKNLLRRLLRPALPLVQRNPWLRALALTQFGANIFMLKRAR